MVMVTVMDVVMLQYAEGCFRSDPLIYSLVGKTEEEFEIEVAMDIVVWRTLGNILWLETISVRLSQFLLSKLECLLKVFNDL